VEFQRTFPDIRMRMQLTDRFVSLLEEHVDVAVRVGELPDSSMIATRVGLIRQVLCASPAYLKRRGAPQTPADLAKHDCVILGAYQTSYGWELVIDKTTQTVNVPSRLNVNLGEAAAAAAVGGAGIARVLSYLIEDLLKSRSLVTLLDAYEPSPTPVSVVYPSQRQVPLKLRAFLDFAVPRLRKRLGYEGA
jgi:DNA-binding transcriptional LysR family regulator